MKNIFISKCPKLRIKRAGTSPSNSLRMCYREFCYKEISLFGTFIANFRNVENFDINFE